MNLYDRFEAVENEFLKFDRVEKKKSVRPDLHVFMLLEELFPTTEENDIVCHAAHDEIWLDFEGDGLQKLTDKQIVELVRCGVRVDSEDDSLCMFV